MTKMYWSASLFALDTAHCYQTSRVVFFCFVSRDKNSQFLVNYAIQAVTEKVP